MKRLVTAATVVLAGCTAPPTFVGTGQFELFATLDGGVYPTELAAGDFDADGVPTLLVGESTGEIRELELRDARWSSRRLPGEVPCCSLLAADLDGDGSDELVAAGAQRFGYATARGGWYQASAWTLARPAYGAALGELLPTSGPELVVSDIDNGGLGSSSLSVLYLRDGRYEATRSIPMEANCQPFLVDLDGDGTYEVVCPLTGTRQLAIWSPTSGESLKTATLVGAPYRGAACDLDHDGRQEALVATVDQGLLVLRADLTVERVLGGATRCEEVRCGDFDGDERDEFAAICDGELLVYASSTNGVRKLASFGIPWAWRLLHADVTGDGVADLVVAASSEKGLVHVFRALSRER